MTLFLSSSGAIAQLGERCNRTAEVGGSIPPSSTKFRFANKLVASWTSIMCTDQCSLRDPV